MRHQHAPDYNDAAAKGLTLALVINFVFTIIEIVGGVLTNSVAVLSDALHDLGDTLALGLAWYFNRLGGRGRDQRHSYGYRRYQLLGSMINALILVVGSVVIVHEAIGRIAHPEAVHAPGVVMLAILGVLMNGWAYRKLHAGHSHNIEVVRLHLLEDVLGWVAVLIGGIVMAVWDVPVLDPILSILISLYILWQVIKRLRQTVRLVMQAVPPGLDIDDIKQRLSELEDVADVHDLHLWSMDGNYHILTVHVQLTDAMSLAGQANLKNRMRQQLGAFGIQHATIEIELPDEECGMQDC